MMRFLLDTNTLNVPTSFATEFSTLCKSTPHPAHRSLELKIVLSHLELSSLSSANKKDSPYGESLLLAEDETRTRDSLLGRQVLYH